MPDSAQIMSQALAFFGHLEHLLSTYIPIPVVIVVSVNLFHVLILSQKSVTSSATNSLLISIAVVEILFPLQYLEHGLSEFFLQTPSRNCVSPEIYPVVLAHYILRAVGDCFRRCSTWLSLFLGSIRVLSLRLALKRRYDFVSEARFGWIVIFITVLISAILTLLFLFRYQIIEINRQMCGNSTVTFYTIKFVDDRSELDGYFRKGHIYVSSFFGKILPSISFPIVAVMLVHEMHKVNRQPGGVSKKSSKTSRMVIYMTSMFVIIELPIGIGRLARLAFPNDVTLGLLAQSVEEVLDLIYVCLTPSHCVICLLMSAQYRNTVRRVLRLNTSVPKVLSVEGR